MGSSPCRPFWVTARAAGHLMSATKLIIACPGRPASNGHKRRMFQWNPAFNCYVFENRLLDVAEFNRIVESVCKKHADLRPFSRVIEDVAVAAPVEPVTTLTTAREVGLDEAMAVVARMAPERLKKAALAAARPPAPAVNAGSPEIELVPDRAPQARQQTG